MDSGNGKDKLNISWQDDYDLRTASTQTEVGEGQANQSHQIEGQNYPVRPLGETAFDVYTEKADTLGEIVTEPDSGAIDNGNVSQQNSQLQQPGQEQDIHSHNQEASHLTMTTAQVAKLIDSFDKGDVAKAYADARAAAAENIEHLRKGER